MTDIRERLSTALADRYVLERQLGQGGMATVYLAHDLKHDRKVAIKVLRPELAAVLGAERFVQEIKTTANLQHPNILPLFDSGEADGFLYYVMPYVEGETLRDKLNRETQLGIEEAVKLTSEVADALDYAHQQNVIHRDIKPENILLHAGRPLVADFGIALAVSAAAGGRMTETGLSLGTPHYMSPEQATADKHVTHRSDIYSLGAVLYEMLTGDPPHTGSSAQQIILKIVGDTARPVTELRRSVPPNVAAATAKALEKLPADRFESAKAFAEALARPNFAWMVTKGPASGVAAWQRRWTVGAVIGVTVIAAVLWLARALVWQEPELPQAQLALFTVTPGPIGEPWPNAPIALSPDGSALVYTGFNEKRMWQLFARRLDRGDVQPVAGTDDGSLPFFSPSGEWVGFYSSTTGSLKKVPLDGGRVVTICEIAAPAGHLMFGPVDDATWGAHDTIVFVQDGRLFRVPASGEEPSLLAAPDSAAGMGRFKAARFIGESRHLVVAFETHDSTTALGTLSLDAPHVLALGLAGTAPRYVEPGYLVFADFEGALVGVPFDYRRLRVRGPAFPITAVLSPSQVAGAIRGLALYDVARSGLLVFGTRRAVDREVVLVDRAGAARVLPIRPAAWWQPRFSPDGRRIVLQRGQNEFGGELWMFELASGRLGPLVADALNLAPEWTADGGFLYFSRLAHGRRSLFRIKEDGSGVPELLHAESQNLHEFQLSPDGHRIVYQCGGVQALSRDICIATVGSSGSSEPLVASPADEVNPQLSPDGKWLAFVSSKSGRNEVYIRRLNREGPDWPVSLGGGTEPRWARTGVEVVFRRGDSVFIAAVSLAGEPRISVPRLFFFGHLTSENTYQSHFDTGPEGAGLVMLRPVGAGTPLEFHFVLNWLARLRPSPEDMFK